MQTHVNPPSQIMVSIPWMSVRRLKKEEMKGEVVVGSYCLLYFGRTVCLDKDFLTFPPLPQTLKMSSYYLNFLWFLIKPAIILLGISGTLLIIFSFSAFEIFLFILEFHQFNFGKSIYVDFFKLIPLGVYWSSLTFRLLFFHQVGNFFASISSNMLSVPFTFSSLWGNLYYTHTFICLVVSFPGVSVVKNSLASARDAGLIPGSGRSPGVGNGNPPQYSC